MNAWRLTFGVSATLALASYRSLTEGKEIPVRIVLVTATILALALALAGWSGGNSANAEGFVSIGQTGPAVDAFWEFDNPDGTVTFVNVFAGEQRLVLGSPPPQRLNQVYVDIATLTLGDPEDPFDDSGHVIYGFGDLAPGQLDIDLAGGTASLDLSLPAMECTFLPNSPPIDCDETTISVNLDWAAASDTFRIKDKFHEDMENCRVRAHFKGELTPAVASGSISAGGGEDQTRGEPSDFGTIVESARDHVVFITDSFEDCFGEPEQPAEPSRAR